MLITKNVNIKMNAKWRKRYNDLGYFYKIGENMNVDIKDVPKNSLCKIQYQCDYCQNVYVTSYSTYNEHKSITNKDACKKCAFKKTQETIKRVYGVEHSMQIKGVKEKIVKTNLEKYEVDYYTQTEEYRYKTTKTNLEKYGVEYAFQNKSVRDKQKQTNLERYGVENVFQNEDIKNKIIKTNIEKYGVEHLMKDKNISMTRHKKVCETMCMNNSQISSKNQRYVAKLLDGRLNYLVDRVFLDVYFQDKNIYIEWNGSGHDIDVKYKKITKEQFKIKELKRYNFLKSLGLKQIVFESRNDFLPNDAIIIQCFNLAQYKLLSEKNNWIIFDIDNNCVILKNEKINYDFTTHTNNLTIPL